MFDYQNSGQLTRNGLTLMLHALIPNDEVNDEQDEVDDFQFHRHRQSLHSGSVDSVSLLDTPLPGGPNTTIQSSNGHHHNIDHQQQDFTGRLSTKHETPRSKDEIQSPFTLSTTPTPVQTTALPPQSQTNTTTAATPGTTTAGPTIIATSSLSSSNPNLPHLPHTTSKSRLDNISDDESLTLSRKPSTQPQYTIDPRLLVEENRIASLVAELHDLNDLSEDNHFNLINELSVASRISPEQERLTIEQLVIHAFKTTPFNHGIDTENSELDYMALEHFQSFVSRNPSILEHLENLLDCITWLDPRCDDTRMVRSSEHGEDSQLLLMVETGLPQILCCTHCGFSIRHCPQCGSGLTTNSTKTFSYCNNEATGLCGGWNTEGKFDFCLQCGDRMQIDTLLPHTLQQNTAPDGVVVVTAPQNTTGGVMIQSNNGSPLHQSHQSVQHVTFNTSKNSIESNHSISRPSSTAPNQRSNNTNNARHHSSLHLPDFSTQLSSHRSHQSQQSSSQQSSLSQLSLQAGDSNIIGNGNGNGGGLRDSHSHHHNHSIPESPHHRLHTEQHGHHTDIILPNGSNAPQVRQNRTSSHHLPHTPSKNSSQYQNSSNIIGNGGGISSGIGAGGQSNTSNTTSLASLHRIQTSTRYSEITNSHSSHHHATTHKQAVHYEGQVFLRSNGIIKHLKSRWLLCRGGFLYLFREREDREPLTVLFLEGSYINPLDDSDDDSSKDNDIYGLEIKTKAHRHTFYMKQHDQRQSWLKILRQASKTQQIENFYTFKKQVGKGKFATVYEATSRLNPDRRYAIKVISKLLMEKPEHLEQLRAEVSIIKLAHHPNIIRMKEMFEDQHHIYLVMPLIIGGDMFDRLLLRTIFSEISTRLIMWRLLSAVDYLHDREIVHCDIKPENILLLDDDSDENVILADFGLSSFFDPGAEGLQKTQGTVLYLAPEVLRGEFYSKSIDIYALGVCAYLFLCGELPFQGYSNEETIDAIIKGGVSFGKQWDNVSLSARLFVQQLLSPNPTDRPSAAQALLDPWFDPIRQEQSASLQQTRIKKTLSNYHSTNGSLNSPNSAYSPLLLDPTRIPQSNSATPHTSIVNEVPNSVQSHFQTTTTTPTPTPHVNIASYPYDGGNTKVSKNNNNSLTQHHPTPQQQSQQQQPPSSAPQHQQQNKGFSHTNNNDPHHGGVDVSTNEEADMVLVHTSPKLQ